jgi:hypothetical protein
MRLPDENEDVVADSSYECDAECVWSQLYNVLDICDDEGDCEDDFKIVDWNHSFSLLTLWPFLILLSLAEFLR